ncbi:MAG TPA: hypothetical protein VK249_25335 [Anaerolineales bacterium]|nr:hypothetical protein [Anaerolineales bacterium]
MKNHFFPGILTPCASTGAARDLLHLRRRLGAQRQVQVGKSGTPVLASGARECAANLPCGHDVANFRELVKKFV